MFASCLAILAVTLSAGDITTIPAGATVVAPGKLNWALVDPLVPIPQAVKAIVVRKRPEGLADVVEVRLWDGTDRLGWMEDRGLDSIRSQLVPTPVMAMMPAPSLDPGLIKPYGDQTVYRR